MAYPLAGRRRDRVGAGSGEEVVENPGQPVPAVVHRVAPDGAGERDLASPPLGEVREHPPVVERQPQRSVEIERPFWAAVFPLTNAVIRRFSETASSNDGPLVAELLRDRSFISRCRFGKTTDDIPAVEISAEDAEIICAWMTGLDGRHYRLPTEAEWEYLARAGATGAFWWEDDGLPQDLAVFGRTGPAPADERRANAWGLIDVLGNVAEWTSSDYDTLDSGEASKAASMLSSDARVIRGGSWNDKLEDLRLYRRLSMYRGTRARYLGVRVVCEARQPTAAVSPEH